MPTMSTKSPPTPLTYALSQLGQHETGPNQGEVVKRAVGLWTHEPPGPEMAWCAGFVSTCLVAGGAENALELGTLGAERLHERMRAYWVHEPRAGDVVWFRRSDGGWHVGLVAAVRGFGLFGEIETVEGNSGNAVSSHTYAVREAKIRGYARPRLIGLCGALPAASGTWAPCSLAAGHSNVCVLGRDFKPQNAPLLVRPTRGQDRALRFLREQAGLDVAVTSQRFGLDADRWHDLEMGLLGLSAEGFAGVCRGLTSL